MCTNVKRRMWNRNLFCELETQLRIAALGLMTSTSFLCLTTVIASDQAPGVGVPASVHYNRGVDRHAKKELDKAIAEYNEAIRLDPNSASAYCCRGLAWSEKNDLDKAIADYSDAIRLDPKHLWAYNNRANAWAAKKEFAKAIADYDEAIRRDPSYAAAYNNRAWLWATCPDQKVRNGKQAVESAIRACELTDWKDANYLETLAEAYAEAGDFDAAVKAQAKAIDLTKDLATRLKLYQDRKPHHAPDALNARLSQSRPITFSSKEKSRTFFTVPYDAILYLSPLGGTAGAVTEFGMGTSEADHTPIFTGLPADPQPNKEVKVGFVAAGSELYFYEKTDWGGIQWAFSHDTKSEHGACRLPGSGQQPRPRGFGHREDRRVDMGIAPGRCGVGRHRRQ